MIHALYERGIAPDLLIGTSAGALNAAFLASRPATTATAQDLAALWRGLRRRDILPLRPATLLSALAGRRDHLIPDQALRRRRAAPAIPAAGAGGHPAAPGRLRPAGRDRGAPVRRPLAGAVLAAAAIPGVPPPRPLARPAPGRRRDRRQHPAPPRHRARRPAHLRPAH